ncbi:MAG: hypothetical protein ACRDPY_04000 [Streptosporangiaceae bacterium]
MDETAAWRELAAAVDAALWRYAEAVTGHPRTLADDDWRGLLSPAAALHLARLSAARRLRLVLNDTDHAAARAARKAGASYPMLAAAAGMARQAAHRRYGPG